MLCLKSVFNKSVIMGSYGHPQNCIKVSVGFKAEVNPKIKVTLKFVVNFV